MSTARQISLKKNLGRRAQIICAMRRFFAEDDYLEVETPIRIPAPAPEAHIEAVASADWFLQTSPELCLKRLLAAGFPRLFQICKCFRRNERGRTHLPELTMLEWYGAQRDYRDLMVQTEDLIRYIARDLHTGDRLVYQDFRINLKAPWLRMSVTEAFDRYASVTMAWALENGRFDQVMVAEIEPALERTQPVFLFDYPAARGALARLKPENPMLAERFELYLGGLEVCNGFSELNDPAEQRARFEEELARRKSSGQTCYPLPEKFLDALAAMPAAAGNALGVDRLVMLFTGASKIDEVVAFTPEEL
ncbi:MAG: EF-P lysine aminoacylase GenX [Desulfobacterales bacterium]|nr:MAG: EF-P lysine aminoacylase GenX [Desulfobacterales bacterium]